MTDSYDDKQWGIFPMDRNIHVIPLNDSAEHSLVTLCKCQPRLMPEGGCIIVVHRSYDRRELTESNATSVN